MFYDGFVASNRRVVIDGKVSYARSSASGGNMTFREAPDGLIDPWLKTLSFWDRDQAVLALHAYATHPMSYYAYPLHRLRRMLARLHPHDTRFSGSLQRCLVLGCRRLRQTHDGSVEATPREKQRMRRRHASGDFWRCGHARKKRFQFYFTGRLMVKVAV
ncbi:MAG: hypothetical protein KatS3mg105_3383 [Gemmatales bacterium]|nr:MAG: hypothetical protein KatS3mg105_3383 [Gemmatales bacterium]